MKLIIGLGNPGKRYQDTRHNVGWIIVDALAEKLGGGEWTTASDFESMLLETRSGSEKVLLAKPTTFMNNSGRAVQALLSYYKLDPTDLIVVHDELDLPLGTVRTRLGGTSAGHNGVGSLIHHLGTDQFWRVRVGIETDHPQRINDPAGFVLAAFSPDEQALLDRVVDETASNLVEWLNSESIPETSLTID